MSLTDAELAAKLAAAKASAARAAELMFDEADRRMGRDPVRMRIVRNVAAREEAERDLAAENEALSEQVERLRAERDELRAERDELRAGNADEATAVNRLRAFLGKASDERDQARHLLSELRAAAGAAMSPTSDELTRQLQASVVLAMLTRSA